MAVDPKRAKNVLVSFSKRRKGLFRKASELCTRCDAQIAILVVSPAENTFSFGHSSVDHVLRRFSGLSPAPEAENSPQLDGPRVRVRDGKRLGNFESVEDLELLKVKYSTLLRRIRRKLGNDESFVSSASCSFSPPPKNDVSFSSGNYCVASSSSSNVDIRGFVRENDVSSKINGLCFDGLDFSVNNEDNFKLCCDQENGRDFDFLHGQKNDMSFGGFGSVVAEQQNDLSLNMEVGANGGFGGHVFGFDENDMSYLVADYDFTY